MVCARCGSTVADGGAFCSNCGAPLDAAPGDAVAPDVVGPADAAAPADAVGTGTVVTPSGSAPPPAGPPPGPHSSTGAAPLGPPSASPSPAPTGRSHLLAFAALGIVVVLALVILSLTMLGKKDKGSKGSASADGFALANGQVLSLYGSGPADAPAKRWTTKLDCNAQCDVTSDGDRVFATEELGGRHRLEAFDAETGKSAWKVPVNPGQFGVHDSMYGHLVLVETETDDGSRLAAYDTKDGTKQWSASGQWGGYAGDGTLILTESNGGNDPRAVAVDVDDGSVKWRSPGEVMGVCSGKVLLARQQQMAVVDESSGSRSWTAPLSSDKHVTCAGDRVFALSGDGVTAFDVADGARKWRATVGGAQTVAGVDELVVVTGSSKAYAFEGSGGKQLWSVAHDDKGPSLDFLLPVEGEKAMVFGEATEALLDLIDGSMGPEKPGPDVTGAALDSLVYVEDDGEQMHSLVLDTLEERWKAPVVKSADAVVVAGGRVFVLASDSVTAYE
jgi:outer membrane protein assembly factor BamB